MFENRVLRIMFGSKREEAAGGWKRLHNEELHKLCASPNIIRVIKSRRMRWVEHVACMGEMRNAYKILDGKPDEKRPLVRPRHRLEDNVRIDHPEIEWGGVWTGFTWLRIGASGGIL